MPEFKNFIITLNNPTITLDEVSELVKRLGFTYFRGQLEKGECGTPHFQACFGGGKKFRLPALQKKFSGPFQAHIEVSKSPYEAWQYCGKAESRVDSTMEWGIPPAALNRKGDKGARNKLLLAKGARQAVDDGDITLEQLPKLKHAIDLYHSLNSAPTDLDKLTNVWIYGPPGTGKSRSARLDYGVYYDKPINKWWCNYDLQPTVILDDFSREHSVLGAHLKRWADLYPFTAETKGGACLIRPQRIVVTSNYTIEEIWSDPPT